MSLVQMSLAGAVLILAIVVIRALAIHRLPKTAFLVLWGVAVVRLLVPYSLHSTLSVYSLMARSAPTVEVGAAVPAVPFVPTPAVGYVPSLPGMAALPNVAAPTVTALRADPWTTVWLLGVAVCAAFFATAYWKCRREFRASLPVEEEYAIRWLEDHPISRTVEIRRSDRIAAPLTYGVLRPVILMPKNTDWSDRETLDYVLTHEYVHIRRFDAVTKLALTAALCVHWFNPAVWVMYVLANRDMELACDEAVIRRFGGETRSAYAMALIRMEEKRSGLTPFCSNFSKNAMEERITAIMKLKKASMLSLVLALALVLGVTSAFATSATPAKEEHFGTTPATDVDADKTDDLVKVITTISHDVTFTSYVDEDGNTWYSFDGGKTYEVARDDFMIPFKIINFEFWTYDEYKEWLENEKVALQSVIGSSGWTPSLGDFVWTQEMVDQTIAMYEGVLENIKNGMFYSKALAADGLMSDFFAVPVAQEDVSIVDMDEYVTISEALEGVVIISFNPNDLESDLELDKYVTIQPLFDTPIPE